MAERESDERSSSPEIYDTGEDTWLVRLLRRFGAGVTGRALAGGATGSFLLKGFSFVAALLFSLLLTNTLGASGYGAFAYSMSWVYLLMIVAMLGFDRLIVREIPILEQNENWSLLNGLLRFSHRTVIVLSIVIALGAVGVAALLQKSPDPGEQGLTGTFYFAMLLLPVYAMLRLRQNILLARQKFITAQLGELLILPWGSLLLMGVVAIFSPETLTAEVAIIGNLVAGGAGLIVLIIQTRKNLPTQVGTATPAYSPRAWLVAAFPMLLVSGMQVVNHRVDIVMVGSLLGAEDAGIYAIANRGVGFIALIFFAVNQPLAPVIARLYAQKKMDRLQNVLVRAARISLMAAVPVGLLIIVFATPLLRFFGEEFPAGRIPMIIMTIGYVITMGFGSVSAALTMTGYERMAAIGIGVSVILNIGLNLLLIPRFGMTGAAWALATGQVTSALLMTIFTFRFLKINSTATGRTL